jgi:hypothetical protein
MFWANWPNLTPECIAWVAGTVFVVLVIYYWFMCRAVLEMLRRNVNTVLLVFSMIALIPAPPAQVLGVVLMIIWSQYRQSL